MRNKRGQEKWTRVEKNGIHQKAGRAAELSPTKKPHVTMRLTGNPCNEAMEGHSRLCREMRGGSEK